VTEKHNIREHAAKPLEMVLIPSMFFIERFLSKVAGSSGRPGE
jgi:hypothetical protein